MSHEMSKWLDRVEKFANDPSPTNYLRPHRSHDGQYAPVARFLGHADPERGRRCWPAFPAAWAPSTLSSPSHVRPAAFLGRGVRYTDLST